MTAYINIFSTFVVIQSWTMPRCSLSKWLDCFLKHLAFRGTYKSIFSSVFQNSQLCFPQRFYLHWKFWHNQRISWKHYYMPLPFDNIAFWCIYSKCWRCTDFHNSIPIAKQSVTKRLAYLMGHTEHWITGQLNGVHGLCNNMLHTRWRQAMKTLSVLLTLWAGNLAVTGDSPCKQPVITISDYLFLLLE